MIRLSLWVASQSVKKGKSEGHGRLQNSWRFIQTECHYALFLFNVFEERIIGTLMFTCFEGFAQNIWNYKEAIKHVKQLHSTNHAGSKWCIVSSRSYFCCVGQTFRLKSAACSWHCSCSEHDTGCLCQTDLSSDDANFPSTLPLGLWLPPCLFLCPSIPSRSRAGHCIKNTLIYSWGAVRKISVWLFK